MFVLKNEVNNTVKVATRSLLTSFLHTNGTFYAKWSTCSHWVFWRPIMRMKHLWDREQRINKAWNYSWVQWRDVDWHGPRRGHTQTCSLTHTQKHTHITIAPLRRTVNVCVNAIWTTTDSFKPLSCLLSPVAFPFPRDSWHSTACLCPVSRSPHTHLTPHTLSLSLPKPPPSSHPSLSRRITGQAE